MPDPVSIDAKKLKVSCEHCSLSELCLPRGLPEEDLQLLDAYIERPKTFRKGEHIYRAGDLNKYIFALRAGSVKSFTSTDDGAEQVLGFHLPGELIGLDGLGGDPHTSSAIALESANVCAIPLSRLEELCRRMPSLGHHMLGFIGREISSDHSMLLLLGKKNADERLAALLLSLSARFAARGFSKTDFNLCMSRQDIGNYLGLAVETVSRLFAAFQESGVLKVERRHITILDLAALQNKVSSCAPLSKDRLVNS